MGQTQDHLADHRRPLLFPDFELRGMERCRLVSRVAGQARVLEQDWMGIHGNRAGVNALERAELSLEKSQFNSRQIAR